MRRLLDNAQVVKAVTYVKKHPYVLVGVLLVVVAGGYFFLNSKTEQEPITEMARTVSTISVAELAEGAVGIAYPTASQDTYVVRAEASGRVLRTVKAGTKVSAGAVLAEIENASERAALTQAQGAYDAARAGAAQSDISLEDARAALVSAKQDAVADDRAALSAFLNVLYNTVDELFSSPRITPGVKIEASGQAPSLNKSRLDLQTKANLWQKDLTQINSSSDTASITAVLDQSSSRLSDLSTMVGTFITLLSKQKPDELFSEADLASLSSEFATAQTSLNSQLATLASAKTSLARAEETVASASIGGTGGEISVANASVKQALGSYQAALANYNKTLVRAPFSGTIVSQSVIVGNIINVGTDVTIIKPDAGVETTRWWHLPLSAVKFTPDSAFVFIVNDQGLIESIEVETGLVTANDLRITGLNGDEVIVIDVRGLKAGDEVEVENK